MEDIYKKLCISHAKYTAQWFHQGIQQNAQHDSPFLAGDLVYPGVAVEGQ